MSTCPHCGSTEIRRNGKRNGAQRWKCSSCNKGWSERLTDKAKVGRKRKTEYGTDRPTRAEYQAAYRARTGKTGNEARDRKKKSDNTLDVKNDGG